RRSRGDRSSGQRRRRSRLVARLARRDDRDASSVPAHDRDAARHGAPAHCRGPPRYAQVSRTSTDAPTEARCPGSRHRRGGAELMASIKRRPDGSYRARYRDAEGREKSKHFERKIDAQRWLDGVTASLVRGDYVDPKAGKIAFGEYATRW